MLGSVAVRPTDRVRTKSLLWAFRPGLQLNPNHYEVVRPRIFEGV